jgi:hypothetical protein
MTNADRSLGSNPSQPPLDRGGANFPLPMSRGSRRGFGSIGLSWIDIPTFSTLVPKTKYHPRPTHENRADFAFLPRPTRGERAGERGKP